MSGVETRAIGGGRCKLWKNLVLQSEHDNEREALAAASKLVAEDPTAYVYYTLDLKVEVTMAKPPKPDKPGKPNHPPVEPTPVPPVADFSVAQDQGLTCTFDGRDSQGNIVSWEWDLDKTDGAATGPVVTAEYPHAGPRNVKLKVTDAAGLTDELIQQVAVVEPVEPPIEEPPVNHPPVADFVVACEGLTCAFDGRSSADDFGIVSYEWNLGYSDGTPGSGSATGPTAQCTYPHAGQRTVTLTVRDAEGLTHSVSKTFDVADVVTPPDPEEPPIEPPQPPITDGVPVFDPGVHQWVAREDLNKYLHLEHMGATNAQIQQEGWPPLPGLRTIPYPSPVLISQPVDPKSTELLQENGERFLRIFYTGVAQQGPDFKVYGAPATPVLATHFFRYLARVNYPGDLGSLTIAVKWFMAWHNNPPGSRFQNNTHGGWPSPPEWPLPTKSHFQMYDGSDTSEAQAMQPVGPYLNDVINKGWFECIHVYRPHTAPGSRDGFNQMYLAGSKIIDVSAAAVDVWPEGGTKPWCTDADLNLIEVANGIGPANDKQVEWGGVHTDQTLPPWTYDVKGFEWWMKP